MGVLEEQSRNFHIFLMQPIYRFQRHWQLPATPVTGDHLLPAHLPRYRRPFAFSLCVPVLDAEGSWLRFDCVLDLARSSSPRSQSASCAMATTVWHSFSDRFLDSGFAFLSQFCGGFLKLASVFLIKYKLGLGCQSFFQRC